VIATPTIIAHLAAAVLALIIGTAVLFRRKGTTSHVWLGRTWVALMTAVAVGSYWIQSSGGFSWIHLLSTYTLITLVIGVHAIRTGNRERHAAYMKGTFVGLTIAGLFTLLPSRLLGKWFFG
jgi:uncharacterized membrane protein